MKNESEGFDETILFPRCRRRLGRRRSCKSNRFNMKRASVDVDETNCVGGGASAPSADGTIRREMKQLARLTWPIVLQMGSQQIMLACDLIYVGRLGRFEMTVGSLFTVLFLLCWYFLAGLTSAMDTLASQAHGANDPRAVKSWTIVVLLVVTVACFPAAAFLFSSEAIVRDVLKRPDAVAREVGRAS